MSDTTAPARPSTLSPRTDRVLIYQGDDIDRIYDLQADVDTAARAADDARDMLADAREAAEQPAQDGGRFGDDEPEPPDLTEAQDRVAAADEQAQVAVDARDQFINGAADRAVEIKLNAIGRTAFRNLVAEHPPRAKDHIDDNGKPVPAAALLADTQFQVNSDTFGWALLEHSDQKTGRRTITAPTFDTGNELHAWLDDLAEGDFENLWRAAYNLNRRAAINPKDLLSNSSSPRLSETAT